MNTSNMWLVYVDESGNRHYQHYTQLVQDGTWVDPETDQDMEIIGWTTEVVA